VAQHVDVVRQLPAFFKRGWLVAQLGHWAASIHCGQQLGPYGRRKAQCQEGSDIQRHDQHHINLGRQLRVEQRRLLRSRDVQEAA
jgi:hypothetical protein